MPDGISRQDARSVFTQASLKFHAFSPHKKHFAYPSLCYLFPILFSFSSFRCGVAYHYLSRSLKRAFTKAALQHAFYVAYHHFKVSTAAAATMKYHQLPLRRRCSSSRSVVLRIDDDIIIISPLGCATLLMMITYMAPDAVNVYR